MPYVAYNKKTTILLIKQAYKTKAAAKAAITRAFNAGDIKNPSKFAVADEEVFFDSIELEVERTNLMSGLQYMERVNTPHCCSPAYETYWSM
ncbi:MAG: hypothetical protein GY753_09665 [Gammaproteobacteria bacterium]|nr:hypothetical protein [Gammaproteobacteria bacterium]